MILTMMECIQVIEMNVRYMSVVVVSGSELGNDGLGDVEIWEAAPPARFQEVLAMIKWRGRRYYDALANFYLAEVILKVRGP